MKIGSFLPRYSNYKKVTFLRQRIMGDQRRQMAREGLATMDSRAVEEIERSGTGRNKGYSFSRRPRLWVVLACWRWWAWRPSSSDVSLGSVVLQSSCVACSGYRCKQPTINRENLYRSEARMKSTPLTDLCHVTAVCDCKRILTIFFFVCYVPWLSRLWRYYRLLLFITPIQHIYVIYNK